MKEKKKKQSTGFCKISSQLFLNDHLDVVLKDFCGRPTSFQEKPVYGTESEISKLLDSTSSLNRYFHGRADE